MASHTAPPFGPRAPNACAQKKQLSQLEKQGTVLSKPMGQSEKAKVQRVVAYEQTSKDLAKWIPSVKTNREADHLSFPLKHESVRQDNSNAGMTEKFVERTALETEVAAVLKASSAIEQHKQGLTETEQLALKMMSPEEARERRKQLGKMRMLESYYEAKCKRMKKIKSKKYRKLRGKQAKNAQQATAAELAEVDEEAAQEQLLKEMRTRAEERMTLRHKNSGKWAKRMLSRRQKDKSVTKALGDQMQLNDELRRKATMENSDGSEAEASDRSGENTDEEVLRLGEEIERGPEEDDAKGLHNLKFMQRAANKKRAEALQQLQELRSELAGDAATSTPAEVSGRMTFGPGGVAGAGDEEEAAWGDAAAEAISTGDAAPAGRSATRVAAPITVAVGGTAAPRPSRELGDTLLLAPESDSGSASEGEGEPGAKEPAPLGSATQRADASAPTAAGARRGKETAPAPAQAPPSSSDRRGRRQGSSAREDAAAAEGEASDGVPGDENPWLTVATDVGKTAQVALTAKTSKTDKAVAKLQRTRGKRRADDVSVDTAVVDAKAAKRLSARQTGGTPDDVAVDVHEIADEEAGLGGASNDRGRGFKMSGDGNSEQLELIRQAFAGDDVTAAEFEEEKDKLAEKAKPKDKDVTLPGWGCWGGQGVADPMPKR